MLCARNSVYHTRKFSFSVNCPRRLALPLTYTGRRGVNGFNIFTAASPSVILKTCIVLFVLCYLYPLLLDILITTSYYKYHLILKSNLTIKRAFSVAASVSISVNKTSETRPINSNGLISLPPQSAKGQLAAAISLRLHGHTACCTRALYFT